MSNRNSSPISYTGAHPFAGFPEYLRSYLAAEQREDKQPDPTSRSAEVAGWFTDANDPRTRAKRSEMAAIARHMTKSNDAREVKAGEAILDSLTDSDNLVEAIDAGLEALGDGKLAEALTSLRAAVEALRS